MRNSRALDALLPKTRQGILAAAFGQPRKAWYASELARRLGVPPSSLQRELRDLVGAEILTTHRQGRMAYYQANAKSPLFPDLCGLMLKTAGLVDVVAEALRPLMSKIKGAFVFGSIATGDERGDSDIDLMVIGTASPMEISKSLRNARTLLGRDINPTVYSDAEFQAKRAGNDHFLTRVLSKPKLFVLGSADELENLAKRGTGSA